MRSDHFPSRPRCRSCSPQETKNTEEMPKKDKAKVKAKDQGHTFLGTNDRRHRTRESTSTSGNSAPPTRALAGPAPPAVLHLGPITFLPIPCPVPPAACPSPCFSGSFACGQTVPYLPHRRSHHFPPLPAASCTARCVLHCLLLPTASRRFPRYPPLPAASRPSVVLLLSPTFCANHCPCAAASCRFPPLPLFPAISHAARRCPLLPASFCSYLPPSVL
ncbi:hypothetical protein B0H14DRAFT_3888764, partial [Mycena olivaceomarginata]